MCAWLALVEVFQLGLELGYLDFMTYTTLVSIQTCFYRLTLQFVSAI